MVRRFVLPTVEDLENYAITDPALNAAVTTAIIDHYASVLITTTGAANAQTIQSPTETDKIKRFTIINNDTSTDSVTVNGVVISPGSAEEFVWDGTAWTTSETSGVVVGPGSSTDNAVARWDGTTGDKLQNSSVTIDDSNNVATTGTITAGGATLTGGTNTFSITNGTASIDIASSSVLDVNANLTVEATSAINQDVTTDATPTFAGASFSDGNITNVGDIALDTISSDSGSSITVTLGTDSGDDFIVGSNLLIVEGDTGQVGIGVADPSQALDIVGSLELEATTSSTTGVIYKGTDRFIHNYKPSGNDGGNTFIGINSGNFSMTSGTASEASYNVGIGDTTLNKLTTGYRNMAMGSLALSKATTGHDNVSIGFYSGQAVTTGIGNVGIGSQANFSITEGYANVAIGGIANVNTTTGHSNIVIGFTALYTNVTGVKNTAIGNEALYAVAGDYNTGLGDSALRYLSTGSFNIGIGLYAGSTYTGPNNLTQANNSIFIGYNTSSSASNQTNEIVIGHTAAGHGSNTATWGNSSITANYFSGLIYTPGSYANDMNGDTTRDLLVNDSGELGYDSSSARYKTNIEDMEDTSWIYDLRPVNFNYKKKLEDGTYSETEFKEKKKYGLIAEEVEKIAPEFVFYDENGQVEGVQYREFISVLIKEIQELKKEIQSLKN